MAEMLSEPSYAVANRSTDIWVFRIPCVRTKNWPKLFLLLRSKAMEFAPFWHPSHSVLSWLQNFVKNTCKTNTTGDFKLCLLPCVPPLPSLSTRYIPSVCPFVCVHAWVRACARARARDDCGENNIMTIYYFWGFNACIIVQLVKRWCAHSCRWNMGAIEMTAIIIIIKSNMCINYP